MSKILILFEKQWFVVFVLISLVFFQLVYSFLFPAYGFDANWLKITAYLPKFEVDSTDNFILDKLYPFISSEYRLGSDTGNYIELAQNFNSQYFNGHIFLSRPLYSFLVFLLSLPFRLLGLSSYGVIFGLSIVLNFLFIASSVLLFFSLLKKLFSFKVSLLSSILLIFSPYVHASLIQPLAEMLMVFVVVCSIYLLYNYVKKPSVLKLVVFSFIIGVFMLGKMFFAISFFILLLAIYFKRYKEGMVFFIVHVMPLAFWYFWVTEVWQIQYYVNEFQNWQVGTWLFYIFQRPWPEIVQILLSAMPDFIRALIYGFLLIPVLFSLVGFKYLPFKSKNLFYFGALFSVFALLFIMNLYFRHHAFLLFPIIYPTAILGMERVAGWLKGKKSWYSPVFYTTIIGSIIMISNINIYRVFDYLK